MAAIEEQLGNWTRLLQERTAQMNRDVALHTVSRQRADEMWDALWENRRVLDASRETLASTTSVSKDPVWTLVSGYLSELVEKTPDPQSALARHLIRRHEGEVRTYEAAVWRSQERVRECEEMLELLRVARELFIANTP